MCSDSPDLPKEANQAKCIAVACFVVCATALQPHTIATCILSCKLACQPTLEHNRWWASGLALPMLPPRVLILLPFCAPVCPGRSCFSLFNFIIPLFGLVSGLMGLLACIGSGLLICCCAPKRLEDGSCKFTAVRIHTRGLAPPLPPISPPAPPAPTIITPANSTANLQAAVLLLIAGIGQLIGCIFNLVSLAWVINNDNDENNNWDDDDDDDVHVPHSP